MICSADGKSNEKAAMCRPKFRLRQCAASNSACGNVPPQIPPLITLHIFKGRQNGGNYTKQ